MVKRALGSILVAAALVVATVPAAAEEPAKKAAAQEKVLDPVCGMKIDPAKAAGTVKHGEKTYHFCSKSCKESFEKDPAKYLEKKKS